MGSTMAYGATEPSYWVETRKKLSDVGKWYSVVGNFSEGMSEESQICRKCSSMRRRYRSHPVAGRGNRAKFDFERRD